MFAQARELAGASKFELEVGEGSTPESVLAEMERQAPGLERLRPNLRCAVDQEYADWSVDLREGAELAFIPPTAGG